MFLDYRVHDRLGEHGLVDLVVSVFSVSDEVDDDVLVPGGPPLRRNVGDQHDCLGVVGVDVEDGGVDNPADVRAVRGGAGVAGVGGEPNLVVGHNMDSSLMKI